MSLSLIFRLQAALFAFFGAMMLLAPGALMGSFNVEASTIAEDIMRGMSLMALGWPILVGKCLAGLVKISSQLACFSPYCMQSGCL